jgi:hypothetical protein
MDYGDEFFHLADMPSYLEVQAQVGREFRIRQPGPPKRF